MRVAVGIATIGRPETLSETLREIAKQTRLPDLLILCPVNASDVDLELLPQLPFPTKVVAGGIGSAHQRNAILRETRDFDAIIFFDDDYFPERSYLTDAEDKFDAATGRSAPSPVSAAALRAVRIVQPGYILIAQTPNKEELVPSEFQGERHLAVHPLKTCMESRDPGTYMSKDAFRHTGKRIAIERSPDVRTPSEV